MLKVSKHTSTNLEEINKKISRLLKDPSDVIEQFSINVDQMSFEQIRDFAEKGGLGACVSKIDVLASAQDELMYLQGERIIILKHIENDIYMGYCEGVIGKFNAESVHFVELDPRVLESLDADLDFSLDQQSISSFSTSFIDQNQHFTFRDSIYSNDSIDYTNSQLSFPSSSSPILQNHHPNSIGQMHWSTHKQSNESLDNFSNNSFVFQNTSNQPSTLSSISYYPNQSNISSLFQSDELSRHSTIEDDPFDTSGFNVDYSDDEVDYVTSNISLPNNTKIRTTHKSTPLPPLPEQPTPSTSTQFKLNTNSNHVLDSPTDEYGFLLSSKKLHHLHPSSPNVKQMKEYREHELKWLNAMNKSDPISIKKDNKFKKLVRSGIPTSVRARVWFFLSGADDYKFTSSSFTSYLSRPSIPIYQVIDRDLPRCYPDHVQFISPEGQEDLGKVLKAYAQYNTHLEYCQGMGRLAGLMLMHMPIEDSFWLLVATIDRYMNGYFTPTLSQLRIDAYIIGQLLKDHQPKLAHHLEQNDVTPIMYIAQWFLTAFTMTLPWESVLRVWDAFYFEGIKVFYRISLAILDVCKEHLLESCPTNSELLDFLLHIPHKYLESTALLDTAFKINLSKSDIKKYAKKAGTEDASMVGLPFEEGLKNLQMNQSHSLHGLKTFGDKLTRKNSNVSFKSDHLKY